MDRLRPQAFQIAADSSVALFSVRQHVLDMARFLLCIWDREREAIIASKEVNLASCAEVARAWMTFASAFPIPVNGNGFALDDEAGALVDEASAQLPWAVRDLLNRGLL